MRYFQSTKLELQLPCRPSLLWPPFPRPPLSFSWHELDPGSIVRMDPHDNLVGSCKLCES